MLNVNDLININRIPDETEISLDLLIDFYEQYLSKRVFIFTLKNGEKVKLFFKETSEIFHISGIDHIYEGTPMDGTRFINEIKSKKISLGTVENVNSAAYKDYIDRIRSMFCIDTIIKNCEYLYYPSGKIPDSGIEVTYLLLKGLNGKNLHLGIDTYKKGRPYFTRTLLITEGEKAEKFIGRANMQLRVAKLEIKDKDTDALLEFVDREGAEEYVDNELARITDLWIENVFEPMLWNYFTEQSILDDIINEWKNDAIKNIHDIHKDIPDLYEMKNSMNLDEWKELLGDMLQESFHDVNILRKVIDGNQEKYDSLFYSKIKRQQKDVWKRMLHVEIEIKRTFIRQQSSMLDPYWSGKLVGEGIRRFEKEEILPRIISAIDSYINCKSIDMTISIIQRVLKDRMADICSAIIDQVAK